MVEQTEDRIAVVALNMGGPIDQDAVEPFLRELFADESLVQLPFFLKPFQAKLARKIAIKRSPEVRENYKKIGGGSPILKTTRLQVEGTVRRLRERGFDAHPFVAMRYAPPRAAEIAQQIRMLGAHRILALSLYPQFSPSTGGSSLDDLRTALVQVGLDDIVYSEVRDFAEEPFYLDAMAEGIREGLKHFGSAKPHVLFSAHGMPRKYIRKGDPYESRILASYKGVVERLPKELETSISFQSRVGPLEWLRPYTEEHLPKLAASGVERLLMVPLGFVSDHVETLYEMDLLYGEQARRLGIKDIVRIPALNDRPDFLNGLAEHCARVLGVVTKRKAEAGKGAH